jgi:hypothetical protein
MKLHELSTSLVSSSEMWREKNDAVPGSNEQVLAAHLPEVDRWLEPHHGRWLVRRAFPQAMCSTQAPFGTQGERGEMWK